MIPPRIKSVLAGLLGGLLFLSCPNPVTSSDEGDGDSLFESFYLATENNGSLSDLVIGEIENYEILLVIPGNSYSSYFVPSFVSSAASVSVNGEEQVSGVSGQNFSSPVEYTLISQGGETRVYRVTAVFLGAWNDMDGSPVGTGTGSNPKVILDLQHDIFPNLIYMDNAFLLTGKYYNAFVNPYWTAMGGSFGTASILTFSSCNSGSGLWAGSINNGAPNGVVLYRYQDPGNWVLMGPSVFLDGPSLGALKVFSGDDSTVFISVIDSYGSSNQPEVWSYNGIWNHHGGGPLSSMSASSFTAGLYNGQLVAAASYNDDPDNIYLYQYDWGADTWYSTPIAKPGHLVQELYQDDETGDLILVTSSVNRTDSSRSDVHWLSWDKHSNSVSDYVEPLTLDILFTDPLSSYWFDTTPVVATSQYAYEYISGSWRILGNGPYSDNPSLTFSIVASSLGYRFIAYQESGSSNVIVKMLEM